MFIIKNSTKENKKYQIFHILDNKYMKILVYYMLL